MIDENDYDVPMITIDNFCLNLKQYDIRKDDSQVEWHEQTTQNRHYVD